MVTTHSLPDTLQARIAGAAYLLVIAGGLFAEAVVAGAVLVPGDAPATALAVAAHETLWRWGVAVHLTYLIPATVTNVFLYGLLRSVQAPLARLALALGVAAVAAEAAILLNLYVPLTMLEERQAFTSLDVGQRAALDYLAISLYSTGFGFPLLLFSGFCVSIGILILWSRLIPHIIGALMIVAGVCYLLNTLVLILSPDLAGKLVPWSLLPSFVGELSLALWLVVKGVNVDATKAT